MVLVVTGQPAREITRSAQATVVIDHPEITVALCSSSQIGFLTVTVMFSVRKESLFTGPTFIDHPDIEQCRADKPALAAPAT